MLHFSVHWEGEEVVEVLEEGCSNASSSCQPVSTDSSVSFRRKDCKSNVPPSVIVQSMRHSSSLMSPVRRLGLATGITSAFHSKIQKAVSDHHPK